MKVAHVREINGPAGATWRLAVALPSFSRGGPGPGEPAPASPDRPSRWLDLEPARRRLVARDPRLAHNSILFRQPILTLDAQLERGIRIEALGEILEAFEALGGPAGRSDPSDSSDADEDDAILDGADLAFGPPILRPPAFRDFYAFERHVRTMWERRGGEIPEAWYRIPVFYFSNTSEIRGPGDPVWAPRGSAELDFELEVGAVIDTPAFNLSEANAEQAIGGYFILNDWSARDLQREETAVRLGPAKGKDFAATIGPWIVTPDELADARAEGASGPDLAMTATVLGADGRTVDVSRGTWASAQFSFAQMLARASADVHLRAGEIVGSGTVGTGCLLEVRDATLGRWLEPGDEVVLAIERLGELRSPVIQRPLR